MKTKTRNRVALALLALLFGLSSAWLARENRELEAKLTELKSNSGGQVRDRGRENISQTTRSNREMTLGQLFQQGGIDNARDLLRTRMLSRQNSHHFTHWKLQHQLKQMSLAELRQLRVELREIAGFPADRKQIEEMISEAEIALSPDDPGHFFDGALKVARFDPRLQKKLEDWASSNPKAAIAWFQSKNIDDFRSGTIADRKNRAIAFAGLLRGIAERDLDLAVSLFSTETRRFERIEGGKEVIPLALKNAVKEGDESLLRTVLESAITDEGPFGGGSGNPWFDYTKATGDPLKSAALLKSLENQDGLGRKMSIIISAQDDLPFEEKVNWLKEQIPEGEEQLQAMSSTFSQELLFQSGADQQKFVDSIIARPSGRERDTELFAVVKALTSYSNTEFAKRTLREISNPELRARAEREVADNSFPFTEK